MMIIPLVLLTVIILCVMYHCYIKSRNLYEIAKQFKGPKTLPIIGNALMFNRKNEEMLNVISDLVKTENHDASRIWMGPFYLLLIFQKPQYVEQILTSQKFSHKSDLYRFLKVYLGNGLVSGSGPRYKTHRRIIQPMLDIRFSEMAIPVVQKCIEVCMDKLEKFVGKPSFDIKYIINRAMVDIVGETIMGYDLMAQHSDKHKDFIQAAIDMYDLGFTRLVKPWLHPDIFFKYSSYQKEQDRSVNNLQSLAKQMIADSWNRLKSPEVKDQNFHAIIDQIADYIDQKPDIFTKEDFMFHMITLYAASEDTLTIITCSLMVCLGMYPEYQAKAAEEVRAVIGETPRSITLEDIKQLSYLDMCIKEVMRLIPIAPYIIRKATEDCQIGPYKINEHCQIVVPIHVLHRDPNYWEKPEEFYPEHFLPEVVQNRHIFAYIPFSAGPRGCVGKLFAKIALKVILVNLLQRFEFEADGKMPDFKLKMDVSTRPVHGYKLRLKKRYWN